MASRIDRISLTAGDDEVDAVVSPPDAGTVSVPVLLTHGAGGDLDDDGLTALADGLAGAGHLAVRTNLPYRQKGQRFPPRAERTAPAFAAIAADAGDRLAPGRQWAVGGKSYGGRVASLAVADGLAVAGLLFYGYPLHPPGKPENLRVDHWPRITVPCLFLQGTRDPFCDLDLLDEQLDELGAAPRLHVVDGGDHSLAIRGRDRPDGSPQGPSETLAALVPVVADFVATLDEK